MRGLASLIVMSAAVLMLAGCGDDAAPDTGTTAATSAPGQNGVLDAAPATMPEDTPPQEEAMSEAESPATTSASGEDVSGPCSAALGVRPAATLAARCIAVSPATHPPCNVENPCQMIQDEIDRSCAMYGPGESKPAECSA